MKYGGGDGSTYTHHQERFLVHRKVCMRVAALDVSTNSLIMIIIMESSRWYKLSTQSSGYTVIKALPLPSHLIILEMHRKDAQKAGITCEVIFPKWGPLDDFQITFYALFYVLYLHYYTASASVITFK